MKRALIAIGLFAAACGSKSREAPRAEPGSGSASGSGSSGGAAVPVAVKVVPLVWTTPGGEPLLALHEDSTLEGPCGPVGTIAGGEVHIGDQKLVWTGVDRKGTKYQVAPLPWTIEVGAGGEVTLTQPDKPAVPLGKVTGTQSEDAAKLFAALVVAAPTIQIRLSLAPADGAPALELSGSADLDAWTIKQAGKVVATKTREQPAPEAKHPVTEAPDGTVSETAAKKVVGTLHGRQACKPHDKAVTALIETLLAR